MAKRHTSQNSKQALGQYFTTNADSILNGYEWVVKDKHVIDPFAGAGDLLTWATKNGAASTEAYDLQPVVNNCSQRDSLVNPPVYAGVVVTNPPYLASNKCRNGDKTAYQMWGASDYYKCHLASLKDADEAIEIIPSNFLCESRATARRSLFETHHIVSAKIWNTQVFDDATTGICLIHIKKGKLIRQRFPLTILPQEKTVNVTLEDRYDYLWGAEFFDYIDANSIAMMKTDVGMPAPNTNLVLGLLDKGTWPSGVSYNDGEPIYCQPKSFTTYQLTIPGLFLTTDQQQAVADLAQSKLLFYRRQYDDLFLANYMGAEQKILSRNYLHRLVTRAIKDLGLLNHSEDAFTQLFHWRD